MGDLWEGGDNETCDGIDFGRYRRRSVPQWDGCFRASVVFCREWHTQTTMPGAGGYGIIVEIEDVFQPDGKFTSLTTGRYASGQVAGQPIGASRVAGTYKVDAAMSALEFTITQNNSTQPTTVPKSAAEVYQILSPTTYTRQSAGGGPVLTYQRVQ